jgi:hypothetical protein
LGESSQLVVEVVAVKQSLNRISSEHQSVLFKLLVILILPILVNVLLVKVILSWWNEGSLDLAVPEILPREILKPGVILDFRRSVESKSVHGFSLDHLIDKVSCFYWPSSWDFVSLNLNLLWQNVISDFLSRFANVRSLNKVNKFQHLLFRTCIQKP